jgi:shikimate dehydrogenase
LAAVIGHPVAHSLSPQIFAALCRSLGRQGLYRRLDLPPSELPLFFRAHAKRGLFTGWNVTIPHKEAMLRLVDKASPLARAVGAVNVVTFGKDGAQGYNTDVYGIRQTLREQGCRVRGGRAVLYGAGGAARAVAAALGESGADEVWVVNRTAARARALCRRFRHLYPRTRFVFAPSADAVPGEIRLAVNATSLGLKGRGSPALAPGVGSRTLAFDLVYTERLTSFLSAAGRRGARTVNGLDMLIWQAIATWEIWFGRTGRAEALKKNVRRSLEK